MCVWNAYTGSQAAAPILLGCGCRIEGLWSGFYTGIATADDRGIYHGKVCGCTRFWQEKFSLSHFPGNTGLFHSRTPGGGDERWGHPFCGSRGEMVLISQGSPGFFGSKENLDQLSQTAQKLFSQGINFPSAAPAIEGKAYPVLADGSQIHISDLVAQYVENEYIRTRDPLNSIRKVMCECREEAQVEVIFKDRPDTIYFGTTTQRIVAARGNGGILASITALAFDPELRYTELPPNICGFIRKDQIFFETLSESFKVDEYMPLKMCSTFQDYLKNNGPASLAKIWSEAVSPQFPKQGLECSEIIIYQALETLYREGMVKIIPVEKPGVCGSCGREDLITLR